MQLGSEFQEMQPNKPDTSVAGFQHRLPSTKENERVSRSSVDTRTWRNMLSMSAVGAMDSCLNRRRTPSSLLFRSGP